MSAREVRLSNVGDTGRLTVSNVQIRTGDTVVTADTLLFVESKEKVIRVSAEWAGVIDAVCVCDGSQVVIDSLLAIIRSTKSGF